MSVWFPKGGTKYFDKALRREFSSKTEKENFLKEHKLREIETDDRSFKHELLHMHEEAEETRRKQGLKPRRGEVVVKDGFYDLELKNK